MFPCVFISPTAVIVELTSNVPLRSTDGVVRSISSAATIPRLPSAIE